MKIAGELESLKQENANLHAQCDRFSVLLDLKNKEIEHLSNRLNTPEIHDFAEAVKLEAAHQRERWDVEHDGGKTDADWFWLIGYLAGKALHNPSPYGANGDTAESKRLHRIITVAAAACNWHAAASGTYTRMRPGIAPPDVSTQQVEGKKE